MATLPGHIVLFYALSSLNILFSPPLSELISLMRYFPSVILLAPTVVQPTVP
jgi:hypothetical protein